MKKNLATPHSHPLNISNVPIFQFKTNNNNNKLFTAYENSENITKLYLYFIEILFTTTTKIQNKITFFYKVKKTLLNIFKILLNCCIIQIFLHIYTANYTI